MTEGQDRRGAAGAPRRYAAVSAVGTALCAMALAVGMGIASSDDTVGFLPHDDPAAVAAGAEIYAAHCASCHGTNLEGQVADWRSPGPNGRLPAPPHDETGHTWHHADPLLFMITKYGTEAVVGGDYRSDMMGFEGVLEDDEILAVLAFIKSTWPPRVIEMHDTINRNAAAARN